MLYLKCKHLAVFFLAAAILNAESVIDSCECCAGPQIARLTARHIEPGGIGYKHGYTSLDLFWAPSLCPHFYGFMDARGHYFNDEKWAANLGLGLRYLPECADVVAGINAYGDWRQVRHDSFFQVGVGLELLWPCWDVRVNGYIPVGKTNRTFKTGCQGFAGHEALTFKKWEVALWGIDAGLGYWLYKSDCYGLHATGGGYYFAGDFDQHAGGGFLRAKLTLWNWIDLKGQVSYDNLFKWQGQGEIAVNFPFGPCVTRYSRKTCSCCTILRLEERLVEQPERFEIIVVTDKKKTAPALSPVTGDPLQIFFVNNTVVSGDGTFEHPFPTLLEAQLASSATDAIYVFSGDGTDKGMSEGIVLQDDQLFTSSFLPFPVHSIFVDCVIPPLSDIRPLISNVNAVVTLANHNTVQGFRINGSTVGIQSLIPIDSLTLFSNIINISSNTGPATGVSIGSTFTGTFLASDNTITTTTAAGTSTGIVFSGQVLNADVQLTHNVISAKSSLGEAIGFALAGPSFTGTLQLLNNTIEVLANQTANAIATSSFQGTATINGNEIRSASTNGNSNGLIVTTSFNGTLNLGNNSISTAALVSTSGVNLSNFVGTFNASGNTIETASQSNNVNCIAVVNFNGNLTSRNNQLLATSQSGIATGIFTDLFNGKLLSVSDLISTVSNTNRALGNNNQALFTGELNFQNDTISSSSETGRVIGIGLNGFNGTMLIGDSDIVVNSTLGTSLIVEMNIFFTGEFNAQNNIMTATSTVLGVGITDLGFAYTGDFIALSNTINTNFNAGIFLPSYVSGTIEISNNTIIQSRNTTVNPEVFIRGSNMQAIILNNVITSAATNNRAFNMINNSGISHLRLDDNILSSPAFTDDGHFQNIAGTFEVESVNGLITGVEIMNNNARLTDTGVITYVVP